MKLLLKDSPNSFPPCYIPILYLIISHHYYDQDVLPVYNIIYGHDLHTQAQPPPKEPEECPHEKAGCQRSPYQLARAKNASGKIMTRLPRTETSDRFIKIIHFVDEEENVEYYDDGRREEG